MKRKIITVFMAVLLALGLVLSSACAGCNDDPREFPMPERTTHIALLDNGHMQITWREVEGAASYEVWHSYTRIGERTLLYTVTEGNVFVHTSPNVNRFKNYYTIVPRATNGDALITIRWNYVDDAQYYWIYRLEDYLDFYHGDVPPPFGEAARTVPSPNRLGVVAQGALLEPGFFSFSDSYFDLVASRFIVVPVRFAGNHNVSFPGQFGPTAPRHDEGGNMQADQWFSNYRTVADYLSWSNPNRTYARTAPRMIDVWRNRSHARRGDGLPLNSFVADYSLYGGTAYQGYNIITSYIYPQKISFHHDMFGPNFVVFHDTDCTHAIEREVNRIGDAMRTHMNVAQFSNDRYAFYFMPGNFNFEAIGARLNIGFYMTISGLGRTPTCTTLSFNNPPGTTVDNRAGIFTPPALPLWNETGIFQGRNGTHNFWRKAENFQVDGFLEWSVSQAAPMRRIRVNGTTSLQYRTGWVSGGFAADMFFNGPTLAGGQQQWYTRSSHFNAGAMSGGAWNVFTNASTGALRPNNFSNTEISTTIHEGMEHTREKPFLYFDTETNRYMVFVPSWRDNSLGGVSWMLHEEFYDNGVLRNRPVGEAISGPGKSIDLEDYFFTALEHDSAAVINGQLYAGKHVLLSPGMYAAEEPVFIGNPNTVLLGTGMATIFPDYGNIEGGVMISDVSGVIAASFVIDTHFMSKYLMRIGEVGSNLNHGDNPTFVSDVFLRVGGQVHHAVHAEVSLQINSNGVVGDHFWIWRGDHGRGIRWDRNVGTFGLVVEGDDVTMHGLFVEHYQKYQTIWRGERGRIFFYQSETPYEFPFQVYSHLDSGNPVQGWADIKVCNNVNEFLAVGLGLYGVHNWYPMIRRSAVEVPHRPGVVLRHLFTNEIGGSGAGWNPGVAAGHNGNRFTYRPIIDGDPLSGPFAATLSVINGVGGIARSGGPNLPFNGANPGGGAARRVITYFRNGQGREGTAEYWLQAEQPLDGNLDYLLQWVMQPCGAGVPRGWDPVWNMRPEGWEVRPDNWYTTSNRGPRAEGYWPSHWWN